MNFVTVQKEKERYSFTSQMQCKFHSTGTKTVLKQFNLPFILGRGTSCNECICVKHIAGPSGFGFVCHIFVNPRACFVILGVCNLNIYIGILEILNVKLKTSFVWLCVCIIFCFGHHFRVNLMPYVPTRYTWKLDMILRALLGLH